MFAPSRKRLATPARGFTSARHGCASHMYVHKSSLPVAKLAREPASVFCQCKIYLRPAHFVVRRSKFAAATFAARPCLAAMPVHGNAPARTCGHPSVLLVSKTALGPGSRFCQCKTSLCLALKHKNRLKAVLCVFSAPTWIRTKDHLLKREPLYQLSYGRE